METKIEAGYVRDKKFAKEFYSYHTYKRPAGIILTIAFILAIISGIINIIAMQQAIDAAFLVVCIIVLRAVRIKKSVKISLARDKEGNHGNYVSLQNIVTEKSILVKSSLNQLGTEYEISCLRKGYRSKNYIYLVTKAKLVIIFDINAFSTGTPEELIEFLRSKGIKIK